MRYPIYFFLLLSGFFYLTGNPINDKGAKTLGVDAKAIGQPLAYARKTSSEVVKNGSKAEAIGKTSNGVQVNASTSLVADKKPVEQATLAKKSKDAKLPQGGWRTSSLQPTKKLTSFGAQPKTVSKTGNKKKLDWTVFGNDRNKRSTPSSRSRDNVDAQRKPAVRRLYKSKRRVVRKKIRKKRKYSRRAKHRLTRSAKRRSTRSTKRYARLKRRKNKSAYRIARRTKKVKRVKKTNYKPRRKKFGFRMAGGAMTVGF